MYVQVRTIDCKSNAIITVSKLTTVEEFKTKIKESLNIEPSKQRLFFRGKQLEEGYKIFDYNINLNDVVQLMVKLDLDTLNPTTPKLTDEPAVKQDISQPCSSGTQVESAPIEASSKYFKVGDYIDAKDNNYGAWFEGRIVSIVKKEVKSDDVIVSCNSGVVPSEDGLLYIVKFDCDEETTPVTLSSIRPRATTVYKFEELKVGDFVMANYNIESPSSRGYWYDFLIERIGRSSRTCKEIWGTIYVGKEKLPLQDIKIKFSDDIMKFEDVVSLCDMDHNNLALQAEPTKRQSAPTCLRCNDKPNVNCKKCGCQVCNSKENPDKQLMCDECDLPYHLMCLDPPLEEIPTTDEWYCPLCKNDENEIVKAGEKLKESKKKAKMASSLSNTSRDWGKGMACVGRTKECTLVPPNHYGPIPGVEVGTLWKFRVQVSEVGVHRPHVAGIHGRESDGAYSIVLSGGYEDDVDDGEKFMYTGSGGRDLSGNKRTAEQSCDQTLTRMNKALALNCNTPINNKGGKAKDWKNGKPIRVVRNYKLAKHSKYAPEEGNRYDGIYKVVEYYPQRGKSGFTVWRYVLRRDDPNPAPWSAEGKRLIERLGLSIIYPEGYLEAMAEKEKEGIVKDVKNGKRVLQETSSSPNRPTKKQKLEILYHLDDDVQELVSEDSKNTKLWKACKESLGEGRQKFLAVVRETFVCICCQEVVFEPVTTVCKHNFCKSCLQRSFSAEVYTCPCCRTELGQEFKLVVNKHLSDALVKLFPGYNVGR